jgi:hypothetical protein
MQLFINRFMSSINLRSQRSANSYNTTSVVVQSVVSQIVKVDDVRFLKVGYYLMNSSGQPTNNEILSIDSQTNQITMSSNVSGLSTGDTITFSWERVVGQPLFNEDFDDSLYELNRTKLESNGSINVTEDFTFEKDIIGQQKLSIVDIDSTGNLSVAGSTTLSGALSVSGATQFDDNVTLSTPSPLLNLDDNARLDIGNNSNTTDIPGALEIGLDLNVGGNLTVTGNITSTFIGNVTGTVSSIANHDTDGLSEGSSNLYFTDSRARGAISVSGDLNYTNGVISFTERSVSEIRGLFSKGGDLSYNSTTGVFSVTTYKDSDVDNHLSGGTGVTYSSGEISIGQSVATTDDVTFNSLSVDSLSVGGNSDLSNFSADIETISFTTGEIPGKEFKSYNFAPTTSNLSFNSFVVVRPPTNTTNYPDTLFSGAHIIDNAGSPEIRLIVHNQGNQAWPPSNINLDFGFLIIN